MILEETSIEQSALYALDQLEPEERERFERDMRHNPLLAECTTEFRDLGAQVALAGSGRLRVPPVSVLTGALERIGAVKKRRQSRLAFLRTWPGVAAACAAMLALFGGGVSIWHSVGGKASGGDGAGADNPAGVAARGTDDKIVITKNGKTVATLPADERTLKELLAKLDRIHRLRPAPGVIQDVARLKRELQSLRKVDNERFSANPRVARTVVIEMIEPGSSPGDSDLSEHISEIIAGRIEVETGSTQAGGSVEIDAPNEGADDQVILENNDDGSAPDLGGTGEGAAIYYRDLPTGSDVFERIDDGRVWDKTNQRIWIETDQAGIFQAVLPPVGFDPDFIADYAGVVPAAGKLPGPVTAEPEPDPDVDQLAQFEEVEPEPLLPDEPEPPVAFSIYDETTGRGSVVVGNLPPAGDGHVYQLWMRNAADDQVVSVGILPRLETGSERFEFDLLGPGITPAGFLLTLEPEGGVDRPGETVILQGP